MIWILLALLLIVIAILFVSLDQSPKPNSSLPPPDTPCQPVQCCVERCRELPGPERSNGLSEDPAPSIPTMSLASKGPLMELTKVNNVVAQGSLCDLLELKHPRKTLH